MNKGHKSIALGDSPKGDSGGRKDSRRGRGREIASGNISILKERSQQRRGEDLSEKESEDHRSALS